MDKSIYLMAPPVNPLNDLQWNTRIKLLTDRGILRENIRLHPNCQPEKDDYLKQQRAEKWGFKVLGAYVGHNEYITNALQKKADQLEHLSNILIEFPNPQARYYIHRSCFNSKVNYWFRTQFPHDSEQLLHHFTSLQIKLIASYHGILNKNDMEYHHNDLHSLYRRVILPINQGGMALRSMRSVHLSGYVCSMAASIHEISKFFPGWIRFDIQGKITHINDNRSDLYGPEIKVIVENIHSAAPFLGFDECISSVSFFNKLIAINSSSTDLPPQQSNIQIEDDMYGRFDSGIPNKKSRQAILDASVIKKDYLDHMQHVKEQADNHMEDYNHPSRWLYRNLVSLRNNSSGAWLNTGMSNEFNRLSPDEFIAACCRRNTVPNLAILRNYVNIDDDSTLPTSCSCDGIVKIIDPYGDHITGCKKDGLAIGIHNCIRNTVAYFLRSLGLQVRIEPTNLFDSNTNLRPDLLISNPPGAGRQIILDIACTGIHGQSRRHDDDPDNPLNVRFEAKMTKYHNIAEEHGFLFIPAIFSYAGQVHEKFYDFISQQIKLKMQFQDPEVPFKEIKKVITFWVRQLSAIMNKVASRNILRGANKLVDMANSAQRVGRALDEINDDGCFITQPATIPIGTSGYQNDLAEVFENVADSIMRQDTIQI